MRKRRSVQLTSNALPFIRRYFTETLDGLIYSTSMKSQQDSMIVRSMRYNSAGVQKLYIIYYQPQCHPCSVFGSLNVLPTIAEAAPKPTGITAFNAAYVGTALCAPNRISLMSDVAALHADRLLPAKQRCKTTYPDNIYSASSLWKLDGFLDGLLA